MFYVYILPLTDCESMKIGFSTGDLKRIIKHNNTYSIRIDKVKILNCRSKALAQKVEKYLLDNIPEIDRNLISKNGHTELREVKYFNDCINLLRGIKNNPLFAYNESKSIEYKLYSIEDFKNLYLDKYNLDISKQVKLLYKDKEINIYKDSSKKIESYINKHGIKKNRV